jgi:hypothetical protein
MITRDNNMMIIKAAWLDTLVRNEAKVTNAAIAKDNSIFAFCRDQISTTRHNV